MNTLLSVQNLCAAYEHTTIFEDISFDLMPGQTIAIVGKSGCGKTTLLHILAGLQKPTSGKIFLSGNDITGATGNVGYMLQKDLLLKHVSVIDNICLPYSVRGISKKQARKDAYCLLEQFHLENLADMYPHQLSGGQRQRIALLRTLACAQPLCLFDEPFSALDALTRTEMQQWFIDVAKQHIQSSILITHDIEEACLLADKILVMKQVEGVSRIVFQYDMLPAQQDNKNLNSIVEIRQKIVQELA